MRSSAEGGQRDDQQIDRVLAAIGLEFSKVPIFR